MQYMRYQNFLETVKKQVKQTLHKTVSIQPVLKNNGTTYDGLINPDASCFATPASMTAAIREYCLATGQVAPETPADYCRCNTIQNQ